MASSGPVPAPVLPTAAGAARSDPTTPARAPAVGAFPDATRATGPTASADTAGPASTAGVTGPSKALAADNTVIATGALNAFSVGPLPGPGAHHPVRGPIPAEFTSGVAAARENTGGTADRTLAAPHE